MDILIPDSWLRDFLKTKVGVATLANKLSLCGPSVKKVIDLDNDLVYSIEVTTNRIDTASINGIAKEAATILARFGIKAEYIPPQTNSRQKLVREVKYLSVDLDQKLCQRFSAILIKNVRIGKSPEWMQDRLTKVGERPINNIVDISNYIMHELGQPVHTFDYDKILGKKMKLRASRKGDVVVTLDNKAYKLPGGDIVIEDGEKRLIDLCGIMGGALSAVDEKTKNVLLVVQTYNPIAIRKTSMSLPKRSIAVTYFEKGLDTEMVELAIRRGIDLFSDICKGKPEKEILDIYKKPKNPKPIIISQSFITKKIGIEIPEVDIEKILVSLGFTVDKKRDFLKVTPPTARRDDIKLKEDIVEEIARIYGYHNIPSILPEGALPQKPSNTPFEFERMIKLALKALGGIEVYTLSLVSKEASESQGLRLRNPLGPESEYLRTSLKPSLIAAVKENEERQEKFHLFEIANIYIPKKFSLPEEKMTLAGILVGYQYREAKGLVETLLEELGVNFDFKAQDGIGFLANHRIEVGAPVKTIGQLGVLEESYFYYEFDMETLRKVSNPIQPYKPIPQYPPQIEDLTITFPLRTYIGSVPKVIKKSHPLIARVELIDVFKDSYTFRVWYQHPTKTLTDKETKVVRSKILGIIEKKFGGRIKN